ncbi:MAG TPA: serpin family protein [Gammaproteobacteria bacterium]
MFASSRIAVMVLVAAALAGCGGASSGDDPPAPSGNGNERLDELPRRLTASEEAVVAASAGFGLELAARVAAQDPRSNVVLSPLSASMALGMAMNGAGGATFEEMRAALGFGGMDESDINAAYRDLIDLLTGLDPHVRLRTANGVWAHDAVPFHDAFRDAVATWFRASVESRDFADPGTVTAINAWVRQQTDGLIDGIVDALDPALVMLLVNAVHFDGEWTTQFDPENTRPQPFRREDGSTVDVEMMSLADVDVRAARGASYTAVELPYGGEAFSMVIVLPDADLRARDWLAQLDENGWTAVVNGLAPERFNLLAIPKLSLTFDAYLNAPLQATGMEAAFRPGADFTRLSPLGSQMCIDFVRQKTRIDVDERGTRAAAATGVGISVVSFRGFTADRSFVLAIRERLTGTLLFVGLVGDPTAEDPGPPPFASDCTGAPLP